MKKFLIVIVVLVGLSLPTAAFASVDDFSFDSFEAVYDLSRDSAGISVLAVEETLVARFPDVDQNRGIRRSIPESYLGTPLELSDISVTDENGT